MTIRTTFFWLLVMLSVFELKSQITSHADFINGEVMVQMNNKEELPELLNKYSLSKKHVISDRFNIYLLDFDNQRSNAYIISLLTADNSVANVQNNHVLSLRDVDETIPDDTMFVDQWALLNTGQDGGTPGADIDVTRAWDISTGGLTAHGDTIVVAVIDEGSDMFHEDMNLWKNRNEIKYNGIDDDNNGYVDDYNGWNAYNSTGVIPTSIHGTHVSGIVGAIGNNDIGVSGVNWNVRVLPVAGASGNESTVVEALSYVYVVREKYDQTDGAEGAFIVADNCSFGVNNGQPEDYPIWEAMYDSLGQLGILSMGATANRNWNIDSVGDVPTAFETDYMISVTNTTKRDERYINGAYGQTTIDLGAPGASILSLSINHSYLLKSGTSMATPHVSGAIALMFAAADSAFIANYKENPDQVALMIKDFILNGVDSIEDLDTVTVSGGRLNVFNSLMLMLDSPVLTTNHDSVTVELLYDTIQSETLVISNSGPDTLNYNIFIDDQPDWFALSQYEGSLVTGESDSILMQFDSYELDTGYYNLNMVIDGEFIEEKIIPVHLYVYDNSDIHDNIMASVIVYPNPFTSSVEFSFSSIEPSDASIEIFDQIGNIVYSYKKKVLQRSGNFHWKNTVVPNGVYYYRILINDKMYKSGKIVKM